MAQTNEVIEWQLVVQKHNDDPDDLDELVLYIALHPGVDTEGVKRQISSRLLAAIEIVPNRIEVLPLAQLEVNLGLDTQMKELRIQDLRGHVKPSR